MSRAKHGIWILSALLAGTGALDAAPPSSTAPEWDVAEWINGDPGTLSEHRGRVVLVHFFQLWCPGCNHFSLPLFQRWDERWGARDDVLIVSIHTVFEGHSVQTPGRLRSYVASEGIRHPVGVDTYDSSSDRIPVTMRRYRTRGTPHVVVIDKHGRQRFSHFGGFRTEPVERLIERLLAEPAPPGVDVSDKRDFRLSGRYDWTLDSDGPACGWPDGSAVASTELAAVGDRLRLALPGTDAPLEIGLNRDSGAVEGTVEVDLQIGGRSRRVGVEVWGWLYDGGERPELDLELAVVVSGTAELEPCSYRGRVRGVRAAERP